MRAQLLPARGSATKPETEWKVLPPAPPREVERLVRELSLPPLLASMLWARGFRKDSARELEPPLEPSDTPGLDEAAERIESALRSKRRILIHGDYDADGVSATAVLLLGLRALGAHVEAFIPHRIDDGYGLNPDRVAEHAERCDLLITVDCGISNHAELEHLAELGVETIVTDHHQPGESLPNCLVVHPSLSPSARPGRAELTGAGIAYHLLWALHRRLGLEDPLEFADIATIGTVADVAPLRGENRALVRAGLERLAHSRWPGLRASVALSGLRQGVTARDVAFVIGPRLNAAGRLGEADLALELLTTASERRARELASYLEARNDDRRKIQDQMFEQALELVDEDAPALVLADDRWHPGVMGIVASKLLEHFYRPVYIIAQGKGSVRSTPGISAVAGLRAAARHLRRFGGHAQAAGFAIDPDQVQPFRDAVCEYVATLPRPVPTVLADAALAVTDVDAELLREMERLEPFGEGHRAPLLALADRLDMARAVGRDGGTLQLRVAGMRGVAWRKGDLAAQLRVGEPVNAAVSVREREWQGRRELEFVAEEIRELRPLALEASALDEVLPGPGRVVRGPAPAGTPAHSPADLDPQARRHWLRFLPLADDPLRATEPLRELLALGASLWLELDDAQLRRARETAGLLPTVDDLRRAFVFIRRGAPTPFPEVKRRLVERALHELDLLDSQGRARRGVKRDPYSSQTLMQGLMERYRLTSLVNAYRTFDDDGFALAAAVLLSD